MSKKKISWGEVQSKIENPNLNLAYVKQLQMLEDDGFRQFMGDVIKSDSKRRDDAINEKKTGG